MVEQIVSAEVAKLAKEKGFDWKCFSNRGNKWKKQNY